MASKPSSQAAFQCQIRAGECRDVGFAVCLDDCGGLLIGELSDNLDMMLERSGENWMNLICYVWLDLYVRR